MSKTIDEKKVELEANGYTFVSETSVYAVWECPDGSHFSEGGLGIPADVKKANVTEQAYAHLQRQRELESLRAFVLDYDEAVQDGYSHELGDDSRDLIQQYNITADESDPDE